MSRDWLLGADRHAAAADHIYAAAADLIARHGFDHLEVEAVARHAHCSRATVYRHTGGRTHLRETVLTRASARLTERIRRALTDLTGTERAATAVTVALREIRTEPVIMAFLSSRHGPRSVATFAESPALIRIASDLTGTGHDNPLAATWLIRSVLSMLMWPTDPDTETRLLQHFLLPALTAPGPLQPPVRKNPSVDTASRRVGGGTGEP